MNCDNMRGCCSPCSQLAQQLEETNTRAVQAYNLAAQAFAAVVPPQGGSNIDVSLVAGPAYEIALKNPMDEDVVINADLTVNGDIYQNGSAYESHAEQLYTTKDTVIMRDGATTGLAPGDVAGLIMKKYDGTNDGALVVSNDGTARVGDVGSEQPLMTRDEAGSMVNGELLQWNGTGQKAVCSGVTTSQIVRGTGNIGSDTKPVKVVGGVATAVTDELQTKLTVTSTTPQTGFTMLRYGQLVMISIFNVTISAGTSTHLSNLPKPIAYTNCELVYSDNSRAGASYMLANDQSITMVSPSGGSIYGIIQYLTND